MYLTFREYHEAQLRCYQKSHIRNLDDHMVAIIIAAHGESAPALLGSTTMIVGDVDNVHAVTFIPGQGPDDLLEA